MSYHLIISSKQLKVLSVQSMKFKDIVITPDYQNRILTFFNLPEQRSQTLLISLNQSDTAIWRECHGFKNYPGLHLNIIKDLSLLARNYLQDRGAFIN
jgi:hypothetical protein